MGLLVWTMFACGGGTTPIRSEPTTPTTEIGGKVLAEPEIVWTELTDVFPTEPCRPPVKLAPLVPGTKGADARAVVDAAHLPGTRIIADVRAGKLVVNTVLDGHPNVGVTLLLDEAGEALEELQLAVPEAEALPVLAARWGEPDQTDFRAEGRTIYRWQEPDAPWAVEILPTGDGDKAVIRYHRP